MNSVIRRVNMCQNSLSQQETDMENVCVCVVSTTQNWVFQIIIITMVQLTIF